MTATRINGVRHVDVSIGTQTVGSNGYVEITSLIPGTLLTHLANGGTLVSVNTVRWTTSTNAIVPVVYADGSKAYLMGAPNAKVTNLTIRVCYM